MHVNDASFAAEIEQANGLVLVDFWAAWCGPCRIVAPILEQLAGEYAARPGHQGRRGREPADPDALQRALDPELLFFKNGQHVDTVVGAVPKARSRRRSSSTST